MWSIRRSSLTQAQQRVEEATEALEDVEKSIETTREQIIAKEQELQRVLQEQPTAPPKKDLDATIESVGTSVEELGTLLKAKGMEQSDADILGGKLKECMDMLRLAEKKLVKPEQPEGATGGKPPAPPAPEAAPPATASFAFSGKEDPEYLRKLLLPMGVQIPEGDGEEELRAAAKRAAYQMEQYAKKQRIGV